MVEVNVTPCNWEVLFVTNAGALLEFHKEFEGVNEIFCTDCEDFNRLGVSRSTISEFTYGALIQFNYYFPSLINIWIL